MQYLSYTYWFGTPSVTPPSPAVSPMPETTAPKRVRPKPAPLAIPTEDLLKPIREAHRGIQEHPRFRTNSIEPYRLLPNEPAGAFYIKPKKNGCYKLINKVAVSGASDGTCVIVKSRISVTENGLLQNLKTNFSCKDIEQLVQKVTTISGFPLELDPSYYPNKWLGLHAISNQAGRYCFTPLRNFQSIYDFSYHFLCQDPINKTLWHPTIATKTVQITQQAIQIAFSNTVCTPHKTLSDFVASELDVNGKDEKSRYTTRSPLTSTPQGKVKNFMHWDKVGASFLAQVQRAQLTQSPLYVHSTKEANALLEGKPAGSYSILPEGEFSHLYGRLLLHYTQEVFFAEEPGPVMQKMSITVCIDNETGNLYPAYGPKQLFSTIDDLACTLMQKTSHQSKPTACTLLYAAIYQHPNFSIQNPSETKKLLSFDDDGSFYITHPKGLVILYKVFYIPKNKSVIVAQDFSVNNLGQVYAVDMLYNPAGPSFPSIDALIKATFQSKMSALPKGASILE